MNYTEALNIVPGNAICYSGFRAGQMPGLGYPSYEEVKEDLPNEEKVSDTIVESNDQSVVEEKIAPTAAKDESIEEVSGKESEPKKAKKKSSKTKVEDKDPE